MSPTEPSVALRAWLHEHRLSSYIRVLTTHPWADFEAGLSTINVTEIIVEAIRAYLDLLNGGIKEVEMLNHEQIEACYGDYSTKSKTYKTMGSQSEVFKEFSVLLMTLALLDQDAYAMPRGKGNFFVAEFEGHSINWTD